VRLLGIDLGGTKIEGVVLDEDGQPIRRLRVATERERGYEHILDRVAEVVAALQPEAPDCRTIGIGTPGSLSMRTGLLKNSNTTCLNGRALKDDLEARLGVPVRLENDANCFALAEARGGAGEGHRVVFGVILGTGVGGGIVVDGRVLHGANAIAGEWGHNPLPLPGAEDHPLPLCYCGRRGCIETYLSGPGMSSDHAHVSGERLEAREIARRAGEGDASCEATLARHERRLARSLATVINILDPDVIVLGGGLSNLGRLYERVPLLWGAHVFSDEVRTRLAAPVHGDSSGVRGAAWLWDR
jgi:fructokinase